MRGIHKTLLFIFSLAFINLLFTNQCSAQKEFLTEYTTTYTLEQNGLGHVRQEITLTNQLSQIYATNYNLNVQSDQISNIQAKNKSGELKTEIKKSADTTSITVYFDKPVVGNGKSQNFSVSYDLANLAEKNGQIYEVRIPRLANLAQVDKYDIKVIVPPIFNKATIDPTPAKIEENNGSKTYSFFKDQILNKGITFIFGDIQIFDFILTYNLENRENKLVETEIALPPDTVFQEVYYEEISPLPKQIYTDLDGNWLARYQLNQKETLKITAQGKFSVYSKPRENFFTTSPLTLESNLEEQKYWEKSNPKIVRLADSLTDSRSIFNFVVKTLKYDYSRVNIGAERYGALEALNFPDKALCMEFTDLFVALCRAKNIPAREVNGYAFTSNKELLPLDDSTDLLHSWPEFWDKAVNYWRPVDPTWQNTTQGTNYFDRFDLNHIVFAIHGRDSGYPLAAGSYKLKNNINSKDIQVTFGTAYIKPTKDLVLETDLDEKINLIAGRSKTFHLKITNPNGYAVYNPILESEGTVKIEVDTPEQIILPFSNWQGKGTLISDNKFSTGKKSISLILNGIRQEYTVHLYSDIPSEYLVIVVFALLALVTGVCSAIMIKNKLSKR